MNMVIAYVSQSDVRVSGRLRGWTPPRWFRVWMIWATRLGDGWLWLSTGLFITLGGRQYHSVLSAVAVAAGITNILVVLLKRRFRRNRPADYAPNPLLKTSLGAQSLAFDRFSFPSGHSMNAFAVATVLGLAFPAFGPLLLLLAASVALSRLVLGQHFLSDVAAGSAIGALVGALSFFVLVG
jgi:undecaprenyl-diphosphatase